MTTLEDARISVAMCTFDGARYLPDQLESIRAQTEVPHEIVICDDGSRDDTIEIINRFRQRFRSPAVVLHQNPVRLGPVANFEQALRWAGGDVTFLCDQDDVWFAEKVQRTMAAFRENPHADVIYSDAVVTDENLRPVGRTLYQQRSKLQMWRQRDASELVSGIGVLGCTLAIRSRFRKYALPIVPEWAHDLAIPFISSALGTTLPLREPLIYYRRHQSNSSDFDGTLIRSLIAGLRTTGPEVTSGDRRRWEAMTDRLVWIQSHESLRPDRGGSQLSDFITECARCRDFGRQRERLAGQSRICRIAPIASSLWRGDYHRYRRGVVSSLKDLLVAPRPVPSEPSGSKR